MKLPGFFADLRNTQKDRQAIRLWEQHCQSRTRDVAHGTDNGEILFPFPYTYSKCLSLSYLTSTLARHFGCGLRYIQYGDHNLKPSRTRPTPALVQSFAARPGPEPNIPSQDHLKSQARHMHQSLTCKEDLIGLHYEDLHIGDLIHDQHLRRQAIAEIDLGSDLLEQTIFKALKRYHSVKAYLETQDVRALCLSSYSYVHSMLPARLAARKNIPVLYIHETLSVSRLDHLDDSNIPLVTGRPPYFHYRRDFSALKPDEQEQARTWGQQRLALHLQGSRSLLITEDKSSFHDSSGRTLLKDGTQPKILVLLNDFCDSVHSFRNLLFPDYYEWADYIFTQAKDTSWEWYAKPHPNTRAAEKTKLNNATVEKLSRLHPHIHFLKATDSNARLVDEGIHAVFTAHGTAGYEFAYLGRPVINAGDNRQINYGFNFHPASREELAALVKNAGTLDINISRSEIEEFVYMNHCHHQKSHATFQEQHPELFQKLAGVRTLPDSPTLFADVLAYLKKHPDCNLEDMVQKQVQYWLNYATP